MSLICWSIFIVIIVALSKWILKLIRVHTKLRKYKSAPNNEWFLGHILDFESNTKILPSLMKYQEYGENIKIDLGLCFPFLVISDLKVLEHILSSSKLIEKSSDYQYFYKWLGTGLLTSSANKWFRMRKILTPTFHFQILEQFVDVFDSASQILLDKFEENVGGKPFDVYPYMTRYTLDVICETSLGTTVNAQLDESSSYAHSVREVTRIIGQRGFDFLKQFNILFFFMQDYWIEDKAVKILHKYTENVIKNRRQQIADNDDIDCLTGKKRRLAFLDMLLQSTIDGRPLTEAEIRDEVNTVLFAGHDTTSSALSFALHCLANHQEIQDKIIDELNEIFAEDKFRSISFKDLQQMKYLEMVIKEALRLYPPASIIARELLQDEKFGDITIPAEVPLIIFVYGQHRNPDVFPDPDKFDPERFLPDNQSKRSPFSYIPFSAGPRNCIGQRFAMLELKATLANILRKYIILPVPEHEIILSFDTVTKSNNGIFIRLKHRYF